MPLKALKFSFIKNFQQIYFRLSFCAQKTIKGNRFFFFELITALSPSPSEKKPSPPSSAPSVLLVEDESQTLSLISKVLEKHFHVISCSNATEALKAVEENHVDIIVTDQKMPGLSGTELLKIVSENYPQVGKIILTGFFELETMMESINQARVDFFLAKPVHNENLVQTVMQLWKSMRVKAERDDLNTKNLETLHSLQDLNERLAEKVEESTGELSKTNIRLEDALDELEEKTTALSELNDRLRILATIDPLTELYNRREFHNRLEAEWKRLKRHGPPVSLLMVDIDFFKKVNDTYGHQCGDQVLVQLSGIIRESVRAHDIPCRYGGEEFVVILPETPLEGAFQYGEVLRQKVNETHFTYEGEALNIRICCGASNAKEQHMKTEAELMRFADMALYRAKAEGRNCTVVLDPYDSSKMIHFSGQKNVES